VGLSIFKDFNWKWSHYQIWYQGLHSWGSDGFKDTNIDLVTYVNCHLSSMSIIRHLSPMVWMTDDISDKENMGQKNRLNLRNPAPITKFDNTSIFNEISVRNTLNKFFPLSFNMLDPRLLRFDYFFVLLFSYAILQEYDNQPEKVGPFNQPYKYIQWIRNSIELNSIMSNLRILF
jgi:hypothetical protein